MRTFERSPLMISATGGRPSRSIWRTVFELEEKNDPRPLRSKVQCEIAFYLIAGCDGFDSVWVLRVAIELRPDLDDEPGPEIDSRF
jgi:hypothetical protein